MTIYICAAVAFVAGVIVGSLICKGRKYDGAFRVNMSDPEKDIFTLELWRNLEGIQDCKDIRFKVITEADTRKKQAL